MPCSSASTADLVPDLQMQCLSDRHSRAGQGLRPACVSALRLLVCGQHEAAAPPQAGAPPSLTCRRDTVTSLTKALLMTVLSVNAFPHFENCTIL